MINWLGQNWGTIVICIVIAAVVFAIVFSLVKNKKAGRSSCGCDCSSCAGCSSKGSCSSRK